MKHNAVGTLTDGVLEGFRQRLRGPLRTAQDVGFAGATQLWNGMITTKPALVASAADTADIVDAVDFAREHEIALSAATPVT